MHRLPLQAPSSGSPARVDDLRDNAEEGPRGGAGLELGRARQRRDQNAAGLGLPPGVDDRAAAVADHPVIPLPGFGIDRLADRAEQAQTRPRGLLHRRVARLHQRADRGRRGVDDVDLVLVDHLPEARHGRVIRHAFEHHRDRAVGERPVDDVAVAGHPADVGGTPVDVAVVIVEHVLMRQRNVDQKAAGGVQHALRLAGRARSVQDEQRVLGVHLLARAVRPDGLGDLVVIDVAPRLHFHRRAGAPHDDDGADAARPFGGHVGIRLQRNLAAAADALVGGDDHARTRVLDAAGQRVRRKAAEHHRVDRPDARAGEHRHRHFGDHRQIDGDAVALLDAARLQHIGEAADLGMQLAIGDLLVVLGIVALPDDRCLVAPLGEMTIEAVVCDVRRAVLEPFDRHFMRIKGGILDLGEGFEPVDPLGMLTPKAVRIVDRVLVHLLVFGVVDERALRPFGRHFIHFARHAGCSLLAADLLAVRPAPQRYSFPRPSLCPAHAARQGGRPYTLVAARARSPLGGR